MTSNLLYLQYDDTFLVCEIKGRSHFVRHRIFFSRGKMVAESFTQPFKWTLHRVASIWGLPVDMNGYMVSTRKLLLLNIKEWYTGYEGNEGNIKAIIINTSA